MGDAGSINVIAKHGKSVAALRFLYKVSLKKDWSFEDVIPGGSIQEDRVYTMAKIFREGR